MLKNKTTVMFSDYNSSILHHSDVTYRICLRSIGFGKEPLDEAIYTRTLASVLIIEEACYRIEA